TPPRVPRYRIRCPGMESPGRNRWCGCPGVSRCQCGPRCHSGVLGWYGCSSKVILTLSEGVQTHLFRPGVAAVSAIRLPVIPKRSSIEAADDGHTRAAARPAYPTAALSEHEDVRDDVAAAARDAEGTAVTPGARIRVRSGDPIEIARKDERRRRIAERSACSLGERPASAFLRGPHCREQPATVSQERLGGQSVFLTVFKMPRDGNLAAHIRRLCEHRDAQRRASDGDGG